MGLLSFKLSPVLHYLLGSAYEPKGFSSQKCISAHCDITQTCLASMDEAPFDVTPEYHYPNSGLKMLLLGQSKNSH